MRTIGSLPNLRALSIDDHRISDDDLRHLSTLSELQELTLNGQFSNHAPVSLTDSSMTFIASTFHKLESLDVSYNRLITMEGIREVLRSCPLRELQASEVLRAQDLVEVIQTRPSLLFVRYGVGFTKPNEEFLEKASVISSGRCLFSGNLDFYEPKFNATFMANQKTTMKLIEDIERMEESNLYED